MEKGDRISFKYKGGRKVVGKITFHREKTTGLILETDYLGRNVDWYSGEFKEFNNGEMKKIVRLKETK